MMAGAQNLGRDPETSEFDPLAPVGPEDLNLSAERLPF